MADIENQQQEPALSVKRKPDTITLADQEDPSSKILKLQSEKQDEATNSGEQQLRESSDDEKTVRNSLEKSEEVTAMEEKEAETAGSGGRQDGNGPEKRAENEAGEDERVLKAVAKSRDYKGKGKLIVEEDSEEDSDDDGDDSSYGGNETGGESDLSEDPLNEVDLDNILPSRTRRRVVQPGSYISNEPGDDDDDDSSEDSET